MPIDDVVLQFSPTSLFILNCILGLVLFGIALDLHIDDFKRIATMPRAIGAGMLGQLILLPALTAGLVVLIEPPPSIALGMILVASCPGGNISNFMTWLGKGNAALSVTLTSIATVAAIIMTPINFQVYGGLLNSTRPLMDTIRVPLPNVVITVFLLIGVPLSIGMFIAHRFPRVAGRLKKPMKIFSLVFFGGFIVVAIFGNAGPIWPYMDRIFLLVLAHNAIAFLLGYGVSSVFGNRGADRRAITLEVGLQNSGLGLFLIFNFFGGIGGMAMVAALWGIWHLLSGGLLAFVWSKRPV